MEKDSNNKMMRGANDKAITARDAFILEKHKKGFTPTEILTLLKREGFAPIARSRVYQILESRSKKIGV